MSYDDFRLAGRCPSGDSELPDVVLLMILYLLDVGLVVFQELGRFPSGDLRADGFGVLWICQTLPNLVSL